MDGNDEEAHGHYYVGGDFAISTKQGADFTVFVVAKITSDGMIHIVDVRKGRWDGREIVDEMFSIQERYQPELFILEEGQIEKSLKPFILEEEERRGVYIAYQGFRPDTDKRKRAKPIQARMRMGRIKFDKEADWYAGYEQELRRFDRGNHDDQVDATSLIGQALLHLIPGKTSEELVDDAWNEEMYDSYNEGGSFQYGLGRNGTTGY